MSSQDILKPCRRGESVPSGRSVEAYGNIYESVNISSLAGPGAGQVSLRDNRRVLLMFVKNGAGATLVPGQLVSWKTALAGTQVTNPAAAAGTAVHGVVDHLIGSAGVLDGEGFLMIILGPTKMLNDNAGTIAEFGKLVVSPTVAGAVTAQTAAPTQGNELAQLNGSVGLNEQSGTVSAGAGATLAQAVSFWGFFRSPFIA